MGWNFKRGEMRKEVCMTWVCQGGPGRTGVHAGWVVQGEFGKGSFTKVWEGRRESNRCQSEGHYCSQAGGTEDGSGTGALP